MGMGFGVFVRASIPQISRADMAFGFVFEHISGNVGLETWQPKNDFLGMDGFECIPRRD